ncbi:unnamed protein product [Litomosoides sigmodontis]|uniref:Uncharacterized protein n=1 Tax=Litomosoides sigmodontis TaxID=42156 RepID=A0A3P6UA08_LITSI|nr:unnamed protein product [Litomosoides sigmodontis]
MSSAPMQHFLTRCSVAVLTGSLAFALTYWYIRRQKNLKCESRNGKMNSESCDKKSLVVTDVMLNVIVEDVEQGLKFDRKHDKVMDVNEVPVLEVPVNSLQETKEDQIDDLPKSDKLLVIVQV